MWNLACAPYLIQKDRAEAAEAILAKRSPDKSRDELAALMRDGEKIKSACAEGFSTDDIANGWAAKDYEHIKTHVGPTEAAQFASNAGTSKSMIMGRDVKVMQRWQFMNKRLEKLDRIASNSR